MRTIVFAAVSLMLLTFSTEAHHRPGHGERQPTGPLHVYDAFEQRLGQYTSRGCFIRRIDEYWVEVCGLDAQGGHDLAQYFLLYGSRDCQGQAYLSTAFEGSLQGDVHILTLEPLVSVSRRGFIEGDMGPLVFAADPIEWVTVQSFRDPLPGGDCINLDGEFPNRNVYQTLAGRAVFVNITDWVPPFSLR
jgi:hypothetical protein